jgi:hypothetical protein
MAMISNSWTKKVSASMGANFTGLPQFSVVFYDENILSGPRCRRSPVPHRADRSVECGDRVLVGKK